MNIYKNFLDTEKFKDIESMLFGDFPWYYRNRQIKEPSDDEGYYFTHSFILNNKINSDFYDPEIKPLVEKLNAKNILEIRANLLMKRNEKYFSGYHIDNDKNVNTAIFYINENNGSTVFKNKKEIFPEKNKIVIFKSNMYHGVNTQTDIKRRIVININYESK